MIVICDNCGKKYQLDPSRIKGDQATGICSACDHRIVVQRPEDDSLSFSTSASNGDMLEDLMGGSVASTTSDTMYGEPEQGEASEAVVTARQPKRRFLGIRGKMFLLFVVIPMILIGAAGYLFMGQLDNLSTLITDEGHTVVTDIAQQIISDKASAVAREVSLYLKTHPDLQWQDFMSDSDFVEVVAQRIGKTGYTIMNMQLEGREPGTWVLVAGRGDNNVPTGKDVSAMLKEKMGQKEYTNFVGMRLKAANTQKLVTGYFRFLQGKEKFQAIAPVVGTPYYVVAATYLDEFTQPMLMLKDKAGAITAQISKIALVTIAITALLVAIITLTYGNMLSSKIRKLTDAADRISMGDMDVVITSKYKDELGDLSDALSRMQDSIRLSLSRLRRRRNR